MDLIFVSTSEQMAFSVGGSVQSGGSGGGTSLFPLVIVLVDVLVAYFLFLVYVLMPPLTYFLKLL